jgi:uncharacterized protein
MIRGLYQRALTSLLGDRPQWSNITKPLESLPIDPDSILEGAPVATAITLTESKDKRYRCGIWDCTAGRFHWFFVLDEIVHILEGEVFIEYDGRTTRLQAGDVAYFPVGAATIWRVPVRVRKFFTHRQRTTLVRRLRGL